MTTRRYEAHLTQAFEDGHSGPARSYWDIRTMDGANIMTLCLHPDRGNAPFPRLTAEAVCYALDRAFEAGRKDKAQEVQRALGLTP